MNKDIYRGTKVRLAAIEPEKDAPLLVAWQRDTEYARLLDSDPVRLWSAGQTKERLEKQLEITKAEREFNYLEAKLVSD